MHPIITENRIEIGNPLPDWRMPPCSSEPEEATALVSFVPQRPAAISGQHPRVGCDALGFGRVLLIRDRMLCNVFSSRYVFSPLPVSLQRRLSRNPVSGATDAGRGGLGRSGRP